MVLGVLPGMLSAAHSLSMIILGGILDGAQVTMNSLVFLCHGKTSCCIAGSSNVMSSIDRGPT